MSSTSSTHSDNAHNTANSSPGFFQNLKNAVSGGSSHHTNDTHNNSNTHSSHNSHDHSSTNLHPGLDRGINHVRSHNMNTTKLTQALEQYAQQSAALKQTGNAVAAAFQACLANDSGPYTQLSNEFANAHLQLMAVNPPMPDRLIRESQSDFDARHQRVDGHVSNLTKLRGRVQHYVDKVNKLRADRDQRMASDKPLTQQELEKLDRNILKARTAEQNYNTANNQLIEEINQLHALPVQHLGPALVAFIGAEQIYAAQSNALLSKIQMDAASLNANSQSWLAAQQPLIAPGTGIITNPSLDSVQRVDINHPTNVAQQQKAVAHSSTQQHHREDSVDSVNAALGTTMIRSEEELRVGTERVEFERIVMRKYVTSEVVNVQVTLRKEHLAIDRTAIGNNNYNNNNNNNHHNNKNNHNNNNLTNTSNYDNNNLNNANNRNSALTGSSVGAPMSVPSTTALPSSSATTTVSGDWEFILSSEHPVVTTKVVPYERIRVRKITERSMERVGADLRKENIDFTLAPSQYAQQQHAGAQVMVREHPETAAVGGRQSLVTENIDGNGIKEYQHDGHANTYEKTDDYRLNNTNTINNTNNANLTNTNTGTHSATQPRSSLV